MTAPLTGAFKGYSYKGAFGNDAQALADMAGGLARGRVAEEERKRQAALEAAMQRMKEQELGLRERQVGQGDEQLAVDREKLAASAAEAERARKQAGFEAQMQQIADDLQRGSAEEQGALNRASAEKIAAMRANADRYSADARNAPGQTQYQKVQGPDGEYVWLPVPGTGTGPIHTGVMGIAAKAPTAQKQAFDENSASIAKINHAIQLASARPQSFGLMRAAGDLVNQRADPDGIAARAVVADIGSLKIHDRSGAAVTAREFPRLRPFIPGPLDNGNAVVTKLKLFLKGLEEEQAAIMAGNPNDPRINPDRGKGGSVDYGLQGQGNPADRWEELVSQGVPKDEATRRVQAEFGE